MRRRVEELRPELIQLLFDCAHISSRAQLAVERPTGARVSSVLFAARVCDLILAEGRDRCPNLSSQLNLRFIAG